MINIAFLTHQTNIHQNKAGKTVTKKAVNKKNSKNLKKAKIDFDQNTNTQKDFRTPINLDQIALLEKYSENISLSILAGGCKPIGISDAELRKSKVKINKTVKSLVKNADIIICSDNNLLTYDVIADAKKSSVIFAFSNNLSPKKLEKMKNKKLSFLAYEKIPRTSKAQIVDILSSQANLTGYYAALTAAYHSPKLMPMLMTSAGTIRPAKAFVIGAGIAGLSAIATLKRLGAIVSATDVRFATRDEVSSLGAKFISIEDIEEKQEKSVYAKELTAKQKQAQNKLISDHIKDQDIIITSALIPGKKAPLLLTKTQINSLKDNAVLIDLAVSNGGNIYGSEIGLTMEGNKKIIGVLPFVPSLVINSSFLMAKNVFELIKFLVSKDGKINLDDEIISASLLLKNGLTI